MKPEEIKEIQRQSFARLAEGKDHGVQERWFDIDDDGSEEPMGDWKDCRTDAKRLIAITDWIVYDEESNRRCEYRIRPDTVNVFGMELPVPLSSYYDEDDDGWVVHVHFKEEVDASQFWRFIADRPSGKYAQKPKKHNVTASRLSDFLQGAFSCYTNAYTTAVASRIIELFERGE